MAGAVPGRRLAGVTTPTDVDPLVARMRPFGTTDLRGDVRARRAHRRGQPRARASRTPTGRRRCWPPPPRRCAPGTTSTRPARASRPCARRSPAHQRRFWGAGLRPGRRDRGHRRAPPRRSPPASSALCEPGDEVVCFEPYYDSYAASIALAGAVRRPVTLRPGADGRYAFDPAELRAAFGPRTRLVLLNSPHNPTGKVFTAAELALIAELCQEHDAYAVTDEVYEHLVFTDAAAAARAAGHACPACGSARCGSRRPARRSPAPAGRSAGSSGPAPLVSAVLRVKQFLTFVNAAPLQPAVAVALALPDAYYTGFRDGLQAKRDLLGRRADRRRVRGAAAGGHVLRHRRHHRARRSRTGWSSAGPCRSAAAWWRCRPRSSTTTPRPAGGWSGSPSASVPRC